MPLLSTCQQSKQSSSCGTIQPKLFNNFAWNVVEEDVIESGNAHMDAFCFYWHLADTNERNLNYSKSKCLQIQIKLSGRPGIIWFCSIIEKWGFFYWLNKKLSEKENIKKAAERFVSVYFLQFFMKLLNQCLPIWENIKTLWKPSSEGQPKLVKKLKIC